MGSPANHRGFLGMRVGLIILISDAGVKFVSLGAELDPTHVLLRVGRGATEVRRGHVPIPEVERVGSGDDEQAHFRMKGH